MSKGFAPLAAARGLRELLRSEREGRSEVRAVLLTTHDLDLRFALAEILPGYLQDSSVIPVGLGPAHRAFRQALLDLPPVAVVYAPEASANIGVPWRPPSLALVPYTGPRRQHSKIACILYEDDSGTEWLRLIASSANLTRRAFTNNLEIAAFEDFALGTRQYPALFSLRGFLEHLGAKTTLGATPAYRRVLDKLPTSAGRAPDGSLRFVHSIEPGVFSRDVAQWIGVAPRGQRARCETLLASPFFPAKGEELERYCRTQLRLGEDGRRPFTLIVDGRGGGGSIAADARRPDGPCTTPPPWLDKLRAPGSLTFVPSFLSKKRVVQGSGDEPPFRGTGRRGRALHAKLIATRFASNRDDADGVWRLFVGSANFTEAGLGLRGERSNLEAGFLDQTDAAEEGSFGPVPLKDALLVEHELPPETEREAPDLEAVFEAAVRGKTVLAALERGACTIIRRDDGYGIEVALPETMAAGIELWLGKAQLVPSADGKCRCSTPTLEPYYLRIVTPDIVMSWPFPATDDSVRLALVGTAGAKRRVDRLLEFWLTSGVAPVELSEEDMDAAGGELAGAEEEAGPSRLGSWRINRLMLGVRRRLAESVRRVGAGRLPSAINLLDSIRIRELVELTSELPDVDALYLGTQVEAMLLGYRASELRRDRDSIEAVRKDSVVVGWMQNDAWRAFVARLDATKKGTTREVRSVMQEAAHVLFVSVRDYQVVP